MLTRRLEPAGASTVALRQRGRRADAAAWISSRLPRRRRLVLGSALAAGIVAVVLALTLPGGGGSEPPTGLVTPIPRSADLAQQARNLAAWLRSESR